MMVARYEVPGTLTNKFRPVGNGMIGSRRTFFDLGSECIVSSAAHTVPPGRFAFLGVFQAINCLATIIQSRLGQKPSKPVQQIDSTPSYRFANFRGRGQPARRSFRFAGFKLQWLAKSGRRGRARLMQPLQSRSVEAIDRSKIGQRG
jgi:hypothetical protein